MNKSSKTGKTLALIGGGIILFGTVLMINDDGGTLTSLAIPFIFIGLLVIMASILFIGNLSNKAFHINNFIFLFMLLAFNAIALFGALFSNTAGSETYFATGLSYVIWGVFYFLQFVRPNKIWRITWLGEGTLGSGSLIFTNRASPRNPIAPKRIILTTCATR